MINWTDSNWNDYENWIDYFIFGGEMPEFNEREYVAPPIGFKGELNDN